MNREQRWAVYAAVAILPGLGLIAGGMDLSPDAVGEQIAFGYLIITVSIAACIAGWMAFAQARNGWELAAMIPLSIWTLCGVAAMVVMGISNQHVADNLLIRKDFPDQHMELFVFHRRGYLFNSPGCEVKRVNDYDFLPFAETLARSRKTHLDEITVADSTVMITFYGNNKVIGTNPDRTFYYDLRTGEYTLSDGLPIDTAAVERHEDWQEPEGQ